MTLTTVRVHLFQIASFFAFYRGIIATFGQFVNPFFRKGQKIKAAADPFSMSLGGKNEKNAFNGLLFRFSVLQYNAYLPVAQLDSASDSDSEGRRFESCRVGQKSRRSARGVCFFGLPAANLSRKRRRFACRRKAASRAKRVTLSGRLTGSTQKEHMISTDLIGRLQNIIQITFFF